MPQPAEDHTRERLIQAAGEVFADQGFQSATVREICARAGANVAAVNYHFRDKMGLYVAVLEDSLCAAPPAGVHGMLDSDISPEQALRLIVGNMLQRAGGRGAWHVRIMAHELAQPSAALDRVVNEVIGPKYLEMRLIIARLLQSKPDDETTRLCAHSIVGQVVHYANAQPVIRRLWPEFELNQERIEQIARHIAEFSLHAIRALAKKEIVNE